MERMACSQKHFGQQDLASVVASEPIRAMHIAPLNRVDSSFRATDQEQEWTALELRLAEATSSEVSEPNTFAAGIRHVQAAVLAALI